MQERLKGSYIATKLFDHRQPSFRLPLVEQIRGDGATFQSLLHQRGPRRTEGVRNAGAAGIGMH